MGNRLKMHLGCLFLAAGLCLLSACGSGARQTETEPVKTEEEKASGDEAQANSEYERQLDLSFIHNEGYSTRGVIPAGGKIVLIIAADTSEEANGSATRLYAANIETGNIWGKYIEMGSIEPMSRANQLCDDGTVAAIETVGVKKNIAFVNPRDMTVTRIALPGEDIMDAAVSPDKKKIAFTKPDGTYLSDIRLATIELILPRKVADPNDQMKDELSRVVSFTPDSTQLFYHQVGYEWDLGYGFFNVTKRSNRYISLPDMAASLYEDNKLLCSTSHEQIPVGYVDLADTADKVTKIDGLPKDAQAYISTEPGSGLIGLIRQKEEKTQVRLFDRNGTMIYEHFVDNPYGNCIRIMEDEGIAVLTTQEYAGGQAGIYILGFQLN